MFRPRGAGLLFVTAQTVVATPASKAFDDPGVFVELPLVNQIRPRVKAGYAGVTGRPSGVKRKPTGVSRTPSCPTRALRPKSRRIAQQAPQTGYLAPLHARLHWRLAGGGKRVREWPQ